MASGTCRQWEVLYRCFPLVRQVREGIGTETIYDTSNGMTLRANIHDEFGRFTIALKPTVSSQWHIVCITV